MDPYEGLGTVVEEPPRAEDDPYAGLGTKVETPAAGRGEDPYAGLGTVIRDPQADRSDEGGSSALRKYAGDPAVALAKGVPGFTEGLIGLGDMALTLSPMGQADRMIRSGLRKVTGKQIPDRPTLRKAAETIGADFETTQAFLDSLLTPEQQADNQAVAEAAGFFGKVKAMVTNPSTIVQSALESTPGLFGGAAVGRSILAAGVKVPALVAAAIGEGAISSGQTAASISENNAGRPLSPKQAALSAGSGAATALLSVMGGKLARRLEVPDIDVLLTSNTSQAAKKNVLRKVAEQALLEGVVEELPQSAQEKLMENLATGRPATEGVADAAAAGMLVGAALGGAGPTAVNPFATVAADLNDIEYQAVRDYGKDRVKRVDPNTVRIATPNGPIQLVRMVEGQQGLSGAQSAETTLASMEESTDGNVTQAAERALNEANGDREAAGKALIDAGWGRSGQTVIETDVVDPETQESIPAAVVVELVAGRATRGTWNHERLHALSILSGNQSADRMITDPETKQTLPEEQLAEAMASGSDHPVVQRIRDFALRVVNAFRTNKQESLYQTANRLAGQWQGQVRQGEARVNVPGTLSQEQRAALEARAQEAARQFDERAVNREREGDSLIVLPRQPRPTSGMLLDQFGKPIPGTAVPMRGAPGTWTAETPNREATVSGEWDVVEAADLVTSDQPGYARELQPRNRDTASSKEQVALIAREPDANRLIDSSTTDFGAPIVDAVNQTVSGNGRVMGLRQAYDANRASTYRDAVVRRAEALGLRQAALMERPVLVRRITDTGTATLPQVAEWSNRPAMLQRTQAELAEADARLLEESGILEMFAPSESGDIRAASNQDFLRQFVIGTGDTSLRTSKGEWDPAVDGRVRRAVLATVLQAHPAGRTLIANLVEEADRLGVQKQADGIMQSAARLTMLAQARPDLDMRPAVAQAVADLVQFQRDRAAGRYDTVEEYLAQGELLAGGRTPESDLLLRALAGAKSIKQTRELLERLARLAENQPVAGQDIFGAQPLSREELIARAVAAETVDGEGSPTPTPAPRRTAPEKPKSALRGTLSVVGEAPTAAPVANPADRIPGNEKVRPNTPDGTLSTSPKATRIAAKWDTHAKFQGNKKTLSEFVAEAMSQVEPDVQAQWTTVVDAFAGGGGYGLHIAATHAPNAERLIVREKDPARMRKVQLYHQQGKAIAPLFDALDNVLQRAVAQARQDGKPSPSAIRKRLEDIIDAEAPALTEDMRGMVKAVYDYADAVSSAQETANKTFEKMRNDILQDAEAQHQAYTHLMERKVDITYETGDSYDAQYPEGPNVLFVADPPYYRTTGYTGKDIVGIDIYRQTGDLIERQAAAGNAVLYHDSAWWIEDAADTDAILPGMESAAQDQQGQEVLSKILDALGNNNAYVVPILGRGKYRHEIMALRKGSENAGQQARSQRQQDPGDAGDPQRGTARPGVQDAGTTAVPGMAETVARQAPAFRGGDPEVAQPTPDIPGQATLFGEGARYQVVGPKSIENLPTKLRQSMSANLSRAFLMAEKAGMPQDAPLRQKERAANNRIRLATGWFKGVDGKWRFETDDSKMKVLLPALRKMKESDGIDTKKVARSITGVITHPDLFRHYPQLKKIKVALSMAQPDQAMYDEQTGIITIGQDYIYGPDADPETLKYIILHELQHAVQKIEGFANGGSPTQLMTDAELKNWLRNGDIPKRAWDRYRKLAGEAEAYAVAMRGDMDARVRKLNDPIRSQLQMAGVRQPEQMDARYQVAQEQDAAYMQAVERGDTETAQRMVDEAAKAAGYTIGPTFHGTDASFTSFKERPKSLGHVLPFGFHFGTTEAQSLDYGPRVVRAFLNVGKMYDATGQPDAVAREIAGQSFREGMSARDALDASPIKIGAAPRGSGLVGAPTAKQTLIDKGFNSIRYLDNRNTESYLVLDPSQIKSADPITRDDQGNVIPLSERFNQDSADIRYQVARRKAEPFGTSVQELEGMWEDRARAELDDAYDVWKDDFYAKPSRMRRGKFYRITGGADQGPDAQGGAGVGDGLYLGRDPVALDKFYREANHEDAYLVEYRQADPQRPIKWLDLTRPGTFEAFQEQAEQTYPQPPEARYTRNNAVRQHALDLGYDGVRYYDATTTGEEFVLYKPELLVDVKTGLSRYQVAQEAAPFGSWGAYLGADDVLIGYRGTRSGKANQANLDASAGTEGVGLYVARDRDFAEMFGEPEQLYFDRPRNPLIVAGEELPILQETVTPLQPFDPDDTPWIRLHKQAAQNVGLNEQNWGELTGTAEARFQQELTRLMIEAGYDAVLIEDMGDVMAGDAWTVLLPQAAGEIKAPKGKIYGRPRYQVTRDRQNVHRTIPRVQSAEQYQEILRGIEQDPRAYYAQQNLAGAIEHVRALPQAEQVRMSEQFLKLGDTDSADNIGALATAALMEQMQAAGDTQGLRELLLRASRSAGVAAQLVRQMAAMPGMKAQRVVEMIRTGVEEHGGTLTDSQSQVIETIVEADIQARQDVAQAEQDFLRQPSDEHAQTLEMVTKKAEKASRKTLTKMAEVSPKTWGTIIRLLMQGNALTPVSLVANIAGNVINVAPRMAARTIAATTENLLHAMGLVKERTVGQPAADTWAYVGAALTAVARDTIPIARTGVAPGSLMAMGEVQQGFQPLRAWVKMATTDGTVNQKVKLLVEGLLGVPAEVFFRALTIGDAPFFLGAYVSAIHELGRIAGLDGAQLRDYMMAPPKEARALAEERAKLAVYQGRLGSFGNWVNMGARLGQDAGPVGELLNALAWKPFWLFVKTPLNIAVEAHAYANPLWSAGAAVVHAAMARKAWKSSRKGLQANKRARMDAIRHQREAMLSVGRVAVGTMMWAAIGAMVEAGLVSGGGGESDKERALANLTLKPFHFNWSGLKRLLAGEDPTMRPGDIQVDYRPMGIIGLNMNIAQTGDDELRRMARQREETYVPGAESMLERVMAAGPAVGGAVFDMSMMKGAYSLLAAIKDRRWKGWLPQWMETVTGVVLPNTLKTIARARLDWMPETRTQATEATNEARMEALAREITNRIETKLYALRAGSAAPGARRIEDLPLRRDLLGRPIPMTPEGRNPIVYHMIDTIKAEQIPMDRYVQEIYRLSRAVNDTDVIPSVPSRSLTNPRTRTPIRLDDNQWARYKEIAGNIQRWGMDNLMRDPRWHASDDRTKAAGMKKLNAQVTEAARREMLVEMLRKRQL